MRGFHPKGASGANNYAKGGMVRGPGTGTSDDVPDEVPEGTFIMPADSTQAIGEQQLASMGARGFKPQGAKVPVNLSNGEFKIPPEQVHAIGVQVLEQMKNATHAPAAEQRPGMFFRDGGLVEEEKRAPISPSNIYPQGHPSAGANVYGGAGMELGSSGKFAKVPEGIGHQPGRQAAPAPVAPPAAPQPSMADQIPTGYNRPAAMTAPPAAPAGFSYQDNNALVGQDIKDTWNKGNYGEAVGKTVAGTVGLYTTPAIDLAVRGASAAWDGAKGFGRGLFGIDAQADPRPAPAAAPPAPVAAGQPAANAPKAAAPAPAPPTAPPTAPPPAEAPAAPQPRQVVPGVYEHGRGNYSDSAAGMGFKPGFTGQPSAQNIAAADAIAARYEQGIANQIQREQNAAAMRPDGGPVAPGSFTGGFSGVIGADPRAAQAQRERSDLMRALTTPVEGARGLTAAQRNGVLSLMKLEQDGVQDAARNATLLEQSRMQGKASRDVALMNEIGSSARAAARDAIYQQRVDLDAQRAAGEAEVRGFKVREAKQMENLRATLLDPKATPEQKRQAREALQAIMGKVEENRFTVVPGGQEWDAQAGAMRNVPARVLNNQTGQFVEQPAQMTQQAQFEKGRIYTDAAGRRARYNGSGWEPV